MRDAMPRDVRTDGGSEPAWIGDVDGAGNARLALLARGPGVHRRAGQRRTADRLPPAQRRRWRYSTGRASISPRPCCRRRTRWPSGVAAIPRRYLDARGGWRDRWPVPGEPRRAARGAGRADARQRRRDRAMAGAAMIGERGAAIVLAMLIAALAAAVAATVFADQQRWSRDGRASARPGAGAGAGDGRRAMGAADSRRRRAPVARSITSASRGRCRCRRSRSRTARSGARSPTRRAGSTSTRSASAGVSAQRERARIATLFAQRGGPVGGRRRDGRLDRRRRRRPRQRVPRTRYYGAQPVPGLAANVPVLRVADLAVVKGVAPRALAAVAPFFPRLPAGTPVNVNTAPPEVLAADRRQPHGRAQRGARRRPRTQKPYTTVAEFRARLPEGATLASEEALVGQEQLLLRHGRGATGHDPCPRPGAPAPQRRRLARRSSGRSSSDGTRRPRQVNYGDAGVHRSFDMTTLRVRLATPPSPDRADAWALFDAAGACVRTGRRPARQLARGGPARDRRGRGPAAHRLRDAAADAAIARCERCRYRARRSVGRSGGVAASGDLAPGARRQHSRRRDRASASDRHRRQSRRHCADRRRARPRAPARRLALVRWRRGRIHPASRWQRIRRRCAFAARARCPRNSRSHSRRRCARDSAPAHVRVDANVADDDVARWQRDAGVAFVRGTPWRWHAAPATAFADAVDLLPSLPGGRTSATGQPPSRLFAPALWIVGAAFALHVLATVVDWASLRLDGWRETREWVALAEAAGARSDAAMTPVAARAAIARRYAELRHAHALPAPDDALPLLARAAPVLATLPPGSLKSATYGDGHWTFDLARVDAAVLRDLDARMRSAGLPLLIAPAGAGARLRFGEQ